MVSHALLKGEMHADILLANLAALAGVAAVLVFGQPLLAAAVLPLALLYRWLQACTHPIP